MCSLIKHVFVCISVPITKLTHSHVFARKQFNFNGARNSVCLLVFPAVVYKGLVERLEWHVCCGCSRLAHPGPQHTSPTLWSVCHHSWTPLIVSARTDIWNLNCGRHYSKHHNVLSTAPEQSGILRLSRSMAPRHSLLSIREGTSQPIAAWKSQLYVTVYSWVNMKWNWTLNFF